MVIESVTLSLPSDLIGGFQALAVGLLLRPQDPAFWDVNPWTKVLRNQQLQLLGNVEEACKLAELNLKLLVYHFETARSTTEAPDERTETATRDDNTFRNDLVGDDMAKSNNDLLQVTPPTSEPVDLPSISVEYEAGTESSESFTSIQVLPTPAVEAHGGQRQPKFGQPSIHRVGLEHRSSPPFHACSTPRIQFRSVLLTHRDCRCQSCTRGPQRALESATSTKANQSSQEQRKVAAQSSIGQKEK